MVNHIEQSLRGARRQQVVTPGLKRRILAAVDADQQSDTRARSRAIGIPRFALATMAAAIVLTLMVWRVALPPATVEPPPEQRFAALLDARLSEPLETLVAAPLQAELVALESDLRRLNPRWPWQPAVPTSG